MTTTPVRLSVRSPDDVLAAVPVILGFEPTESVAMLTFGGNETFHARVDLPASSRVAALVESVAQLVRPARRHGIRGVLLVVYTHDRRRGRAAERELRRAFGHAGVEILEVLCADGRRWCAGGRLGESPAGVRYDASTHRFRAESVLQGRVVHGSREELVALLDPVEVEVAAIEGALATAVPLGSDDTGSLVARAAGRGRFEDTELAGLLLGLLDLDVRDAAWAGLDRSLAEAHVALWTDAVQRSPDDLVAAPAAVLAPAAWLSGHGALAWCAVDRSRASEPDNSLAAMVADLLAGAVSPQVWSEWSRRDAAS